MWRKIILFSREFFSYFVYSDKKIIQINAIDLLSVQMCLGVINRDILTKT